MTNEELVVLIQNGERDRIPELWAQVERLVYKHALKWATAFDGRNGATAEDYVQAGFIGFLDAVDYYKPDSGNKFTTVLGLCIKTPFSQTARVRTSKQRHEPRHWDSLDAPVSVDDDGDPLLEFVEDPHDENAFREVEDQQLREVLAAALATLSEDQQRVIRLRYWYGFQTAQVAEVMGVSQTKARQLEAKALRALRRPQISRELKLYL